MTPLKLNLRLREEISSKRNEHGEEGWGGEYNLRKSELGKDNDIIIIH